MAPNPLTYPSSSKPFTKDVFLDPPREYRGAPFWAWNHKQEEKATVLQVGNFDEMGMGGFHMHTRVGLDIHYMGDEYMKIVKSCVNKAKEKGMYAFLYDEDRWPSGFAGGKVLEGHPELRGLHILFTPWPYGSELPYPPVKIEVANAYPVRSERGFLLAKYDIELSDGQLVSAKRLNDTEEAKHTVWYAYCEPNPDSGYMGDQTLPDLLSVDMAKRFIETTHEVYKQHVGDEFGKTIPSMFTDEPQYCPIFGLNKADGKQEVFLPWTPKMEEEFRGAYGTNITDKLPEIVWDTKDQEVNVVRYQFINLLSEMFSNNYLGTISRWCEENGIACTGHLNAEPTLASQTMQMGEAMRAYRSMQFPGIDMLCDRTEYNTAKQAQSVSRQYGRGGVMCEMYGVTGWAFTFEGHKGQGDWQAALGVTLRVHHLAWSSMEGEAKRDYPACIGYQSPWYKEYKAIETHFARVNATLTRGRPVTRIAVIHPIESFWLCAGPKDKNFEEMEYRDQAFANLTEWLLKSHIDFDFISESLFPDQTSVEDIGAELPVGQCSYEAVVVPHMRTIRSTTLVRLQKFAAKGGKVIFAGSVPTLVDLKFVDPPFSVSGSVIIPWSKAQILAQLQPLRDIEMVIRESTLYRTQGYRADSLFYQMRRDGAEQFLFIANSDRKQACPVDGIIKGEWKIEVLDTLSGDTWELATKQDGGKTRFSHYFDGCESVLFHLTPGQSSDQARTQTVLRKDYKQVADLVLENITFSEPNVLLLDYCSHRWKDEAWQPIEEVLRIDQALRARLGFFIKGAKFRQPWTIPLDKRAPAGALTLKFAFESDVDVSNVKLAIESPCDVRIQLDDRAVSSDSDGWWVDEAIRTIPLPNISRGEHIITLEYQYGPLTNLERIYLLGDFGVSLHGRTARIVPVDKRRLEWGDLSRQGYPFYTGNVHYHCSVDIDDEGSTALRVARFTGPTVSIDVDGKRAGLLIHEPYALELNKLSPGKHKVDVTMYGNRYNAFGELHLVPGKTNWIGADMWRTEFDWWTEEYALESSGILNAPRVLKPGKEVSRLPQRRG